MTRSPDNPAPRIAAQRIVVFMPSWLGDAVMATPFLQALRHLYPSAHIAALHIPLVAPVLAGLPFINEPRQYTKADSAAAVRWLKAQRFDLAILLPNSFRSALMAARARIPHRLGYGREWRSALLTDRLRPIRRTSEQRVADRAKEAALQAAGASARIGSPYQPVPTIDYYLALAEYLGAPRDADRHMTLAITPEEAAEVAPLDTGHWTLDTPSVVLVPGANFGSSKCWPPEHFAAVAAALIAPPYNARVLIASSPRELPIVEAILGHLHTTGADPASSVLALAKLNSGRGVSLGALKELTRRAALMICNDTGPRHFAAAFGIPIVTLFGPTDPRWAETYAPNERQLSAAVACSPCQLKACPIDHRCMKTLTPAMVLAAVAALWPQSLTTDHGPLTPV